MGKYVISILFFLKSFALFSQTDSIYIIHRDVIGYTANKCLILTIKKNPQFVIVPKITKNLLDEFRLEYIFLVSPTIDNVLPGNTYSIKANFGRAVIELKPLDVSNSFVFGAYKIKFLDEVFIGQNEVKKFRVYENGKKIFTFVVKDKYIKGYFIRLKQAMIALE